MSATTDLNSVLGKAIALLRAFRANDDVVGLAELSRRTGVAKPTAYRLANELSEHGLLEKVQRGYRLSGGLFELGLRAVPKRNLLDSATPYLQDLFARTNGTVHLGVPKGNSVVYVAKLRGHQPFPVPTRIGGRMPMYCTAIGKALLSHSSDEQRLSVLASSLRRRTPFTIIAPSILGRQLDQSHESRLAYEKEESAIGVQCVASPILDAEGRAVAAISVSAPLGRVRLSQHAEAIREAAGAISRSVSN